MDDNHARTNGHHHHHGDPATMTMSDRADAAEEAAMHARERALLIAHHQSVAS